MSAVQQWEAFQLGARPDGVPRQILDSWKRSKWNGISADTLPIPWLPVPDDLPFVRTAEPILLDAADTLPDSRTVLALSDERGHIVWRWASDPAFARELDRGHLEYGSVFDEDEVGTNGIGVALETGRTAVVIGAQHYVRSYHRWACTAAPVRHPLTGRIVGAVNISSPSEDANRFFRLAAHSLAKQVEGALLDDLSARERTLHDAFVRSARTSAGTIVALDGTTLITNAAAARLSLDHVRVWRLVRAAAPGARIELGDALEATVRFVDDDAVAAGAILEFSASAPDAAQDCAAASPVGIDAATDPTAADPADPAADDLMHRRLTPLERAEFEVIRAALARCGGIKKDVARELGISRSTLYEKLHRYHLA